MKPIIIALDAMGGDRGAEVVVPAALRALKKYPNLKLILVGDEKFLQRKLHRRLALFQDRLSIHHASEVVAMDELPSQAVRNKKDSSMRVAINLIKEKQAQACVSAGNTGALMVIARFVLKMLPGIDRPAIIGCIPAANPRGYVWMLDLGANIDVEAQHLFQFAVMASVMVELVDHLEKPQLALLNVGEEEMKGNEKIKEAATLLQEAKDLNYIGFIEGNDIFSDVTDIIITDGFVGNIALKTSEGLAKFIRNIIYAEFKKNILTRFMALCALPVLRALRKKLNPARYNGASLLGLNGIVVKSHGGTTAKGFLKAIEHAIWEAECNVSDRIASKVATVLQKTETQTSEVN